MFESDYKDKAFAPKLNAITIKSGDNTMIKV